MTIATITNDGQTIIPREIRSYLRLHTGDKIQFIIKENGTVILMPLTVHVRELKGILPKPKKVITIERMKETIAKRTRQ